MLALCIIGGIALLIALLLCLRVGCRADYSGADFILWIKLAFLRFQVSPRAENPKKEAAKQKKLARKKKKKDTKDKPESETPASKKPLKGDLKWLLTLLDPALTALDRLRRKLRVDNLSLWYSIGGKEDPAKAALRYGIVAAGGGSLIPLLDEALDVRNWDVHLDVDFEAEQSRVALTASATYRIGQLLGIFLALGWSALMAYLNKQKQPNQKEEQNHGRKASNR